MKAFPRPFSSSLPSSILIQRPSLALLPNHRPHNPQPHPFTNPNHHLQTRHESTARRHRKLLNIAPAPFYGGPTGPPTGASGRSKSAKQPSQSPSLSEGDHIVFNPPASAPNVYHTPRIFLPKTDLRLTLYPEAAAIHSSSPPLTSSTASTATQLGQWPATQRLPPPVREPYTKKYHVTPPQMEQMRQLRRLNERVWTRTRLAERFQCSQLFVGMVVQASEERLRERAKEKERVQSRWGPRRRAAREERRRRREAWGREE